MTTTDTDRLLDARSELRALLEELNARQNEPGWSETRFSEGFRSGLLRGLLALDRALRGDS